VRIFVDPHYLKQRAEFDLRATCEDCVHFDNVAQACSLTFHVEPHLQKTHGALQDGDAMMYCKTFEME